MKNRYWIVWMAVALLVMFAPLPTRAAPPQERFYRVEASQFEYRPAILKANPGDRVTIELAALDVVHGLAIDGYNLETTAEPGQPARLTFTADRSGAFRLRCTMTCGNLHPFMIGKLNVGDNQLLWRASGLAFLAALAGAASRPGREGLASILQAWRRQR
jgi:heme/copper-type cytochrome/quinol oxidase subunit 2